MMIRTRRRPSVSKGPPVSASQNKEQIFLDAEGKRKEADRRRQDSIGAMKVQIASLESKVQELTQTVHELQTAYSIRDAFLQSLEDAHKK